MRRIMPASMRCTCKRNLKVPLKKTDKTLTCRCGKRYEIKTANK